MIPHNFKPMLAVSSDKVKQQPKERYCSIKLDGCRVLFFGGVAYSRTLKPLPNKQLQDLAQRFSKELEGCDGEVIAGGIYDTGCLQRSVSFCMNADKQDDFRVWLFDRYFGNEPWLYRFGTLQQLKGLHTNIEVLDHFKVVGHDSNIDGEVKLDEFESVALKNGAEGVIVRDAQGKYKCGRSGTNNPELQKLKRMQDAEFLVVGYTQFEHNANEAYIDETGKTKRSTSKEGKELMEQLGSLICQLPDGKTFNVGAGFTLEQRKALWASKYELEGKQAKVQFFRYSPDGVPLLPVFLDFRHPLDM